MNRVSILVFILHLLLVTAVSAQSRNEINLSDYSWQVWLDSTATWKNDTLFLPRTLDLSVIPSNAPTCGWDELYRSKGIKAKVPASFEELFGNGNPLWRYHGVGWFFTSIEIPASWNQKVVWLNIEKARLRVEIYINEQLAGYDIVAETPYSADISSYLKPGQKNRIAIRVTNPGGQRGWNDAPVTEWGKYKLSPGHDFGGLGNINLTATGKCYINDLFVKNLLPAKANNIELQVSLSNTEQSSKKIRIEAEIVPYPQGKTVLKTSWEVIVNKGETLLTSKQLTVPDAKLWDVDSPNLYYCKVSISGEGVSDNVQSRFGFRVFEAKANHEGKHNYYLNGKRIRIRSSIDWGYYWQTGFYATDEMARKSVENAKAIGNNCISFHRRIGEPLVMKYADELGLLIYGEPGGMQGISELRTPSWIMNTPEHDAYFAAFTMPEKFSRMVYRDRNHPSVVIWGIVNEQSTYDYIHKKIFDETWKIDNSRMLVNQSGGHYGDASGYVPHMRPYEFNPRLDYISDHTVDSKSRFQELDLFSHESNNDSSIIYWGEVRCYTGPDNYYLLSKPSNKQGYDYKSWEVLGEKTEKYFNQNNFSAHPTIKGPADLSKEAGRGLMYINGRLSQGILANNTNDGYAINGWSGGDQSLGDDMLAWYSAICDEGRNLKGPASDYKYWNRSLQIVARRLNGKYFEPGDKAKLMIGLINENKISKGLYQLKIEAFDGSDKRMISFEQNVKVLGDDDHAQTFLSDFSVMLSDEWHAGYITIKCSLLKDGHIITNGSEQVLLKNRKSYKQKLSNDSFTVLNWNSAQMALEEAGAECSAFSLDEKHKIILAGDVVQANVLLSILEQVNDGSALLIKFNSDWAEILYEQKILKSPVAVWGGEKKPYWNGNGWGYLDLLANPYAIPSNHTIGTNSWEANSDPVGFEPFESHYPQKSHGAFFFRPDNLLTLIGEISYGKGKIILAPTYPVDDDNAFNDMIFFNLIEYLSKIN